MKAAKPQVKLISYTQDAVDLLIFTKATRLTMNPSLLQEIKKWPEEKKMKELEYMSRSVPSSWEFCTYVFLITGVSRAFTHQFVRTRNASYAQQSLRVIDRTDYEYVYAESLTKEGAFIVAQANAEINNHYKNLIEMGEKIEDARGILPTNIATNIVAQFNLRTFVDICRSRTGGRTQQEYQIIANMMVDEVLKVHPWAEKFMFVQGRDHFTELEELAKTLPEDKRIPLLKIADAMRKK